MDELRLPYEVELLERQLERFLSCGPRPEPSVALRRRVLSDARSELRRGRFLPQWRFAATFAATVLVVLGLWLGMLQATSFALPSYGGPLPVEEVARRLQVLSPNLSQEDSVLQAKYRQICAEAHHETPAGETTSEQGPQ
jgi:hypothetical protein